jgi:sugar lactone lactonase YvrE
MMPARFVRIVVLLATPVVLMGGAIGEATARRLGDSRVIAKLPPRPGYPEGIAIEGQTIYVATLARFGTAFQGPPEVQAFDSTTGQLVRRYVVPDRDPTMDHGLSGEAFDANGRLYVLDTQWGVVRIDTVTGDQEIYAPAFPDLPPCVLGGTGPCSPTLADTPPLPNDLAFDELGNAYVTDSLQGTIWRVPPGGGPAEIWFQDARIAGAFGPNGIRLSPDRARVVFSVTIDLNVRGVIYTLPIAAPTSGQLRVLHRYRLGEAPDNLAFGLSGKLYVALAGSNQISVLRPGGAEARRFSGPARNDGGLPVPYDMPSGVAFDDSTQSLLVNNHSEVLGIPRHFVVFDVFVKDQADPLVRPALA